jgi:hypothetical protein
MASALAGRLAPLVTYLMFVAISTLLHQRGYKVVGFAILFVGFGVAWVATGRAEKEEENE